MASDLALPPVDAMTVFPPPRRGGVAVCNGGGDFFLAGSRFILAGQHADILLGVLPPIVHIRKEADQASLRWALDRMRQELREPLPGGALVAEHLAHLMLVQALRLYLAEGLGGRVGWLFALADKQMGAAIDHMHADPAHRWTLQELAERVGMSRTAFAVKFKATVGVSPMDYLTRWRMLLAADGLANSGRSLSAIAASLGYESESAFGAAFKRVMGCSPRQYHRGRSSALASPAESQPRSAGEPDGLAPDTPDLVRLADGECPVPGPGHNHGASPDGTATRAHRRSQIPTVTAAGPSSPGRIDSPLS